MIDQRAHPFTRAPVACSVEDRLRQCAGGEADAETVTVVDAGEEINEAGEAPRELERDGEEGADRLRGG